LKYGRRLTTKMRPQSISPEKRKEMIAHREIRAGTPLIFLFIV
jgi:hypothetical protein